MSRTPAPSPLAEAAPAAGTAEGPVSLLAAAPRIALFAHDSVSQPLARARDWKNMTTLVSPLERLAPVILSPLVLSHRLIDLAEDVGRAGYAAIAEELIELAYKVLDAGCQSAS